MISLKDIRGQQLIGKCEPKKWQVAKTKHKCSHCRQPAHMKMVFDSGLKKGVKNPIVVYRCIDCYAQLKHAKTKRT